MKITQNTDQSLVIDIRSGYIALLFIASVCLFGWFHFLAFQTNAPLWVHLLIGTFTALLLLIAIQMPRRDQVVLNRETGRAELRKRQGRRYTSRWFDLPHLEAFVTNPTEEGFAARQGSLERVYLYMHVTGGMDAGFHLISTAAKSQTRTKRVTEAANAWLRGPRT